MVTTDPIADMLTRIRNANQQKHETVSIPYSNLKNDLANILKDEGFVTDFVVNEEGNHKNIVITLKYKGNERVITGLKRVSKPGLRQYAKVNEIPKVLNGLGIVVLSTSQGLMTDKEARAKNIGGEVLAYIW
ncbi:MAG: 30S ribosomal protein S8 [Catenibacterium mitsuokai]|jgi:small subunit ribosomal protein S8|uniref:30S ribosomal protein S8 n=1 Tax=Catenibacterium TaxID=135858 RepID=UPI0006C236F6|nr:MULTISPECIES: 30S ribosomal protein S8 [Catenibacterium]CUP67377.1 30S ribosomal protein S8 [Roseburia hominis]MCI6077276.1 30S ribosomal protein S8 [Catenibacterium mitsuokai]MDD6595539.1 30S ribosomal protein S8 [Catenibacterium mitsuokai]MDY3675407.1 30S ribosomal protein S8 [Catenibacterium mitsuokai]MEE0081447.1 30S ribosomal protein S8 [Catenibacterium mitsuokai]